VLLRAARPMKVVDHEQNIYPVRQWRFLVVNV
jgi:hypothetical protein